MAPRFQLLYSPQSPYVRKVVIAARLLGLNDRIERLDTKPNEASPPPELTGANPLGKVPTLIVLPENPSDAKRAVFDSSIIVQYLDTLANPRDTLYPPSSDPKRIEALNYEALADGVMDAAWLFRAESMRPESLRSIPWITGQNQKIQRGVQALAKMPLPEFSSAPGIVLSVMLWYLSRRVPDLRWQEFESGRLEGWYKQAVQQKAWVEEGEVPPS